MLFALPVEDEFVGDVVDESKSCSNSAEDQLLNLLDRLHSHEFNANAVQPLKEGDLVRIKTPGAEWIDTLKLTSEPAIVDRRETGLPVWRLEVVDAVGIEAVLTCDRTVFEPAPSE